MARGCALLASGVAALCCCLAGRAFVATSGPRLGPGRAADPHQGRLVASPADPRKAGFAAPPGRAALSAAALALAALCGARARGGRRDVSRGVTREEVEALQVHDMPTRFERTFNLRKARAFQKVLDVRQQLERTFFLAAVGDVGCPCKDWQQFKFNEDLPKGVYIKSIKNRTMRQAIEGSMWEAFTPACIGTNTYIFAENDYEISEVMKLYFKLEKKWKREQQLAEWKEMVFAKWKKLNPQNKVRYGAIVRGDWKLIPPEEMEMFKEFPSRKVLIGRIAGGVKQVPTKLAKGVKQLPWKTAVGLKKIVEKMEEKGLATIGDAVA